MDSTISGQISVSAKYVRNASESKTERAEAERRAFAFPSSRSMGP